MTEADLLAAKALPEEFDWRNVDGKDYVSPIRNQASCGSCYAFGTLAMFEARVRILTNGTKTPVFSTQDIVSCSEYSQGCEGGTAIHVDIDTCNNRVKGNKDGVGSGCRKKGYKGGPQGVSDGSSNSNNSNNNNNNNNHNDKGCLRKNLEWCHSIYTQKERKKC